MTSGCQRYFPGKLTAPHLGSIWWRKAWTWQFAVRPDSFLRFVLGARDGGAGLAKLEQAVARLLNLESAHADVRAVVCTNVRRRKRLRW